MKKQFESFTLSVLAFTQEDIITKSTGGGGFMGGFDEYEDGNQSGGIETPFWN